MKKALTSFSLLSALLLLALPASAHVIVRPDTAGIGAYQTFTVSVPTEKTIPTVGLRLIVPAGVESVTPTVKQGWAIMVEKAPGQGATTTQIVWTGSHIPAGQRDEFSFSAKMPAAAGQLVWKAYQTYSDGSVVSWDAAPHDEGIDMDDDSAAEGPYSVTNVVDDLTPKPMADLAPWAFGISILALLVALYGTSTTMMASKNQKNS